jgi:para-nitrobenzyl esterase
MRDHNNRQSSTIMAYFSENFPTLTLELFLLHFFIFKFSNCQINPHSMKTFIAFIGLAVLVLSTSCNHGTSGVITAGENIAVVTTQYGDVRGYTDGPVFAFKGIPYAKADRFMPPQAPDKWEGKRQCTIYGPQAMQGTAQKWTGQGDYKFGFTFSVEPMDEKESFVLNIWTNGINDHKKRPVWFWIHGGGYANGSGNQLTFFDGRSMAEKGDIVVVTVNHRLNILGYLDLRGLGGKYSESVNLGMQDLVFALKWVHDNIENFGGDPNSVTIDGQSGGGGKVSTLMAMPSAAGLFHRAIVQSGSTLTLTSGDDSKEYGMAYMKALGLKPEQADSLNKFTYDQLVEAGQKANAILREAGRTISRGGGSPSVDGKYIVQNPFDPTPAEFSKNIPMMIGSNLHEFGYNNRAIIIPQTMEQVRTTLTQRYGAENAEKYIAAYKQAYPNDDQPQHILATNIRTNVIKQATVKSAQGGAPVYVYLFEWLSPVNDGSLGACHGMELPFMFNNVYLARPMTGGGEDAYRLEDKISSSWISFIRTGNPNNKSLRGWQPFEPQKGATMILNNKCEVRYNHDKALIDLVASLPPAPNARR